MREDKVDNNKQAYDIYIGRKVFYKRYQEKRHGQSVIWDEVNTSCVVQAMTFMVQYPMPTCSALAFLKFIIGAF